MPPTDVDPARLAIFDSLVSSIAEEMGAALRHTALSPNIKERADFSCAVFDHDGQLLAQAAHIPVHLGAMPESVRAVERLAPWRPGDLAILNDPFLGGTHLPDVTMVSPVFAHDAAEGDEPMGYVASRAHQADIGGMAPGSMPVARELIQEGLVIPPIRLYRGGELVEEAMSLILRNVRTPDERRGDFNAQIAAQRLGAQRLADLQDEYGADRYQQTTGALLDYGERLTRAYLRELPHGSWSFEDVLDDDGHEPDPVPIRLSLTLSEDRAHFDFSGSAPQRAASINAVAPVTRSACYYVIRCLLPPDTPMNSGLFRPITFTLPERSVVAAQSPVAVAAGNVETSQRIVDTVWGAFAQVLPEQMPAASSGTMNNLTAGGVDPRNGQPWAYYETSGGGLGGGPSGPGLDAAHSHMTNTLNTPAEALELAYPLRVIENSIRARSSGAGAHRGGHGLTRRTQFLAPAQVTIISERRRQQPWGASGGLPGRAGRNSLERPAEGRRRSRGNLPGKVTIDVQAGEIIRLDTPGGGGWGAPESR
ncbi:MAG: hydantoinase B/oxoprolinase family protein [Chloroflexi bacterium]|nr:hydantoinase B/oxoprolinase family protein [Chloroflexota bacterium]MYF82201.1 hydantoinase B/oxoprolinase family protein [Chloroflexota bacterium]MYI04843.1 hydantoinase B/oxoprolinase family protein [Chloroflexota bacterium]